MLQPPSAVEERRHEPRRPAACAIWYRPTDDVAPRSAWLTDICTRGAAFLVPTGEAPAPGQRLELSPMHTDSRLVREGTPVLPPAARVLRVEPTDAPTRKGAVCFEPECSVRPPLPDIRRVAGRAEPPLPPPCAVPAPAAILV